MLQASQGLDTLSDKEDMDSPAIISLPVQVPSQAVPLTAEDLCTRRRAQQCRPPREIIELEG